MYIPWYAEAVKGVPAFQDIKKRYDQGESFVFLEFDGDGRDLEVWPDCTEEYLQSKIDDKTKVFGHGFVLAAVLRGFEYIWE